MNKNIIWQSAAVLCALGAGAAQAQSSGNFAASVQTTQCTVNRASGALVPGPNGGTLLETTIQTPNSAQTALVINPSLVTGLYTNTLVTETAPSSTEGAAVVVSVTLDGKPVLPATDGAPSVIYDERFQQLSTNVFSHIQQCSDDNTVSGDQECNIDLALSTLSAHGFNFMTQLYPSTAANCGEANRPVR